MIQVVHIMICHLRGLIVMMSLFLVNPETRNCALLSPVSGIKDFVA